MPLRPKDWDLRFPAMGVVRRHGQEQPVRATEYASPWAVNCRLADSLSSRLRGGSFTAIAAGSRPSEIVYRDRLLTFSDNAVTASRLGDHTDTTMSADVSDTLRPALFQFSHAADTGGDIVALVPHKDAFLLGFTADETWVQQGDPLTGSRRRISDEVGIVGADAWCVNHDTVYFLSSSGLYSVGADGSELRPLSEEKVPEELTGVTDAACTLTYNHSDRGIYIHKTGVDWFYDTTRDQFWPFDLSTANSHVLIGPLRIGGVNQFGLIQTIHGIVASGSEDLTWRIVTGDTAEEAAANGKLAITAALAGTDYEQYVSAHGTWEAGRSFTAYPRVRAMSICVWLSSTGDWAFEGVTLRTAPFGKWR